MRRLYLYGLTGLCLVVGLSVLLSGPFPTTANRLVGGVLLGGAVGGVLYMIVGFGGPGERGPDF